ncbi:MAG TPA: TIM44-like domain-containing protein [Azospirillaceae bacterium]|nr:TIM44-like domain-containing protein [Azospirillaceae bacterium]
MHRPSVRPKRRLYKAAAVALAAAIAVAPSLADARAGGGRSAGSRGTNTYSAPPATSTAPRAAQPMERSATPQTARPAQPGFNQPSPAARPGGLFSRGFGGALLGGLIGAGLFGLLFGHGLFGGMMGFGSILGLLLQLALIGGLVWLAVSFFRRRQQPVPAGGPALGGASYGRTDYAAEPRHGYDVRSPGMAAGTAYGAAPVPQSPVAVVKEDYDAFERLLSEVQDAWSRGDRAALSRSLTPEMAGYFEDELAANTRRGLSNRVEQVRLLQGDLAEAWREGNLEYATVAMRFAAHDYMVETATGRVVEGDPARPVEAVEVWTFVRPVGGAWQLSAIQQA